MHQKICRFIFYILLLNLCLLWACSNNPQQKKDDNLTEKLIGKWQFNKVETDSMSVEAQHKAAEGASIYKGLQFDFKPDGQLIISLNDNSTTSQYKVMDKGKAVIVDDGHSKQTYHIRKITDDELVLRDGLGTTVSFSALK